jgi:serpin B
MYSILGKETGNIFFSPYSISQAFAVLNEGAKGNTAKEIETAFGLPEDSAKRKELMASINARLNSQNDAYKLSVANAIWMQNEYPILDSYKNVVTSAYGAEARNLDFVSDAEPSRKTINSWVADKTNQKILELLPQGSIDAMTRLVITNAIYFKGTWVKEFEKNKTKDGVFTVNGLQKVNIPFMYRQDEEAIFNYMENSDLQMLEMGYKGDTLSMIVLLPKKDITKLENTFTLENLNGWKTKLVEQRVNVVFPKFKFTTNREISNDMKELGIKDAFTDQADFSGIATAEKLSVTNVYHKAFVEVNEEGTEAAAATGIIIGITSIRDPPVIPSFTANHPFLFLIQEKASGNILFMGRVNNPNA